MSSPSSVAAVTPAAVGPCHDGLVKCMDLVTGVPA